MNDPGTEFAKLLVAHDREIRRYISVLVPQRDSVEEILQQTASLLWEKFTEYDRERPFLPWAVRFAYFEVLNYRKNQARNRFVYDDEVLGSLAQTRDELCEELEQRRLVLRKCLTKLPTDDRSLLERRYSDSITIKLLAEETGRTAKALYRRLDRIRELIAACVEQNLASGRQ